MGGARARPLDARRRRAAVHQRSRRQGRGASDGNGYPGQVTTPATPLPVHELEGVPPPPDSTSVEELLRLFGKAARAHQLYLPNNPIYKSALDNLRAGFLPIWAVTDEVALGFTESEVKYAGSVVLDGGAKSSDNLAWLFYKDGV